MVIIVRNTMVSLFNLIFLPKLHCSNEDHVKQIVTYRTRNIDNIPQFNVRHTFFGNSYFPSIVTERNNLGKSIKNSESFSTCKKNILKFIRTSPNSIFNCHNPKGVKLLTKLRLGLSHLRDHQFKHSFQDKIKVRFKSSP